MNQIKIGKFIAECRKKQHLTQMQLAEKLYVTDRAISKWETGKALPDSTIMLELCSILKISVDDLLSGEVVTMNNFNEKHQDILLEVIRQKENSDKRLLTMEWVISILSIIILLVPIIIVSLLQIEEWKQIIVIVSCAIPSIIGLLFAISIEQTAGYYQCKSCGHKYVPTYKAVFLAQHIGRTRRMKCPNCGKRSWNKKVIKK
ncbi:MAG: helix-turn-helix domain-containing protein [Bacilli bacterium]|nr:helix-turn-helix domain-containing protein [Bacilli bacterium]